MVITNVDFSAIDQMVDQLSTVPEAIASMVVDMPAFFQVAIGLSVVSGLVRIAYEVIS